jgi:hypothetical protein
MIDRDILLLAVGGLIGAVSSWATLFIVYILEGMRLRRQWIREDQLRLREKREELQAILMTAGQTGASKEEGKENL